MRAIEAQQRISLKNILVATDFSPVSDAAVLYAEAIARRYGAKVFVAHVMTPEQTVMLAPESWGACQQMLDEAAKLELQTISKRLGAIPHEMVLMQGGIRDGLAAIVEKHEVDLLVMGTHGRGGVGRLMMGSVCEEIFRRSSCPVLTVTPQSSLYIPPEADFKEIVLATNLGSQTQEAVAYALSLAQDYQAHVTLLHVVPEPVEGLADMDRIAGHRVAELRQLVPHDAELWCRPECVVQFGNPAQLIVDTARDRHADLIVLGARQAERSLGVATHLSAATAHTVVTLAPCPVLTLHN